MVTFEITYNCSINERETQPPLVFSCNEGEEFTLPDKIIMQFTDGRIVIDNPAYGTAVHICDDKELDEYQKWKKQQVEWWWRQTDIPHIKSLYVCNLCGTTWNGEADAIECEKRHVGPVAQHVGAYGADRKYPNQIITEFADGRCMIYHSENRVYSSVEEARKHL